MATGAREWFKEEAESGSVKVKISSEEAALAAIANFDRTNFLWLLIRGDFDKNIRENFKVAKAAVIKDPETESDFKFKNDKERAEIAVYEALSRAYIEGMWKREQYQGDTPENTYKRRKDKCNSSVRYALDSYYRRVGYSHSLDNEVPLTRRTEILKEVCDAKEKDIGLEKDSAKAGFMRESLTMVKDAYSAQLPKAEERFAKLKRV
ncbi:MAG: hypothetical protein FWE53_03715 [Firmicutes bacterium]|nr:hypothetical protein [Bacillota bacterium]